MNTNPSWWFKPISEAACLVQEPDKIEYLRAESGETFIHTFGTVFWIKGMDVEALKRSNITHWRIVK